MNPDEIYEEVARRKRQAKDSKIADVVFGIYQNPYFRAYPTWIASEHISNRDAVPPDIIAAERLGNEGVKITFTSGTYSFNYAEEYHDFENDVWIIGKFELLAEDQLVLAFQVRGELGGYDTRYSLQEIEAFIEGPWIEDMKRIAGMIKAHVEKWQEEQKKREKEDPHKLEDLRKRFGI